MNRRWPVALAAAGAAWYASESLRHRREQRHGYELRGDELAVGDRAFLHACEALTAAPVSEGNDLEVLINGDEIFPAYLETIRAARSTINLLTYVYWQGDIAHEVAGCLVEKARQGVEVNVLLDSVGAAKMDRDLVASMRDAGVCVSYFRPPRPYAVRRLNNRTHRKLLIVDGEVGLTGGVGIAEEWTGDAQDPEHWRDTHVLVRGPVVRGLQGAFAENWLEATGDVLVGPGYLPDLDAVDGGGPMQLVRSSAGVGDTNVEALYFLAIASAREALDLTAAYFAPRPAFLDALCDAADRGVAVRVLVPGPHIDKQFVRVAGRAAYDRLLDHGAGVRVPTDDAAREDAVRRRDLVLGRLRELRQPLLPVARRGDAVRPERDGRRDAHGGVRGGPVGVGGDAARSLRPAPAAPAGGRTRAHAGAAGAVTGTAAPATDPTRSRPSTTRARPAGDPAATRRAPWPSGPGAS
jgi:cardiolipin synthase